MRELRFTTRISETGNIQVLFDNSLYDKEVEVIIKPRKRKYRNEMSASEFVNKWAGFLKTDNTTNQSTTIIKRKILKTQFRLQPPN